MIGCTISPKKPPEDLASPNPSPKELMKKYDQQKSPKKSSMPQEFAPLSEIEPQAAFVNELPYENKLFSITATDKATLGELLSIVAAQANLSLVIGNDIDQAKSVSVNFTDAPLDIVLDHILSVFDYFYTIENEVLRVQALKTVVFNLDYPLVSNEAESETGGDVLGGGGGGGAAGGQDVLSSTNLAGEFTIETEVEEQEHLDIWQQLEDVLNSGKMLTNKGSAQINRMSGTIMVRDRPRALRQVEQFINLLKQSMHRQVSIEAKIVEVTLNKGHKYGINWQYVKDNVFGISGHGLRITPSLSEGFESFTVEYEVKGGSTNGTIAVLDALATQGDVNLLSSPRLNVINNQSALISVGDVIPYLDYTVGQTTETSSAGTERQVIDTVPVISRTLVGVTLGITPQISDNGNTILHIVPIVTEQAGTRTISIKDEVVQFPVFSVRESDTMVKVEDRQTIVIGGLITEKSKDTNRKTPVLGDMPFLNYLFTHQQSSTTKSELVILLTTTVVSR